MARKTDIIILGSVDPWLILFTIPPVIGSLYFGFMESGEEFAARREETTGKRKMEYAKRVFYEKKYKNEIIALFIDLHFGAGFYVN